MDDRIKKRIVAFYVAGFLNLVLGFYLLLNGRALVDQGTFYLLLAFFFGFAAVDFWFARNLRRNWAKAQARLAAGQGKAEGNPVKRES
jgi:hypothetical protein